MSRTLVIAAAFAGLGLGWKTFWFLCDDAYIVFRYVSNHQLGWGYTWNPPPFQPVEGYTNFLWVALLDGVWTLLGVEPPDAANWLSLIFAAGTLALVMALAWRLPLAERLERYRTPIVALVLLGTLSNRTFLTWTSSGLGTSLFTFLLFCFVAACFALPDGRGRITAIVLSTSLMAVCRPDGLLYLAFSGAIYLLHLRTPRRRLQWRDFACILPVVIPVTYLLWHRASYGYWLPNTYYAKHAGAWPEAGVRYLASFVLEYALWMWVGVAAAAAIRDRKRLLRVLRDSRGATLTLALLALVGHFSYYTFVIGGDHFEYRIYHHLVPLLWLSLPWLISRLALSPWRSMGLVCIAIALSWPIPWTHWSHTREFTNFAQTFKMRYEVAPKLPAFARPYTRAFDDLQYWLIDHMIGVRHQTHKVFWQRMVQKYPERVMNRSSTRSGFPVTAAGSVGVLAWALPRVSIIDKKGLNDVAIAHTHRRRGPRRMAHDRAPPAGYVQCFRPNVVIKRRQVIVEPRDPPLEAKDIVECERRF